jgi:hypothetical protein
VALVGAGVALALLALEGAARWWPGLFYPGAMRTPFGVEQATRREQERNPGEARAYPETDSGERPRWYGVPNRTYWHYGMEYSTYVQYNALGFRDDEHPTRLPGVRRIVVLGDSFVEAREVAFEETFHQQFERDLNALRPGSVEVINLGMAGLGTVDEYLILREFGPEFVAEGDVVVMVLYVGNDIWDNSLRLNTIVRREPTADRPGFVVSEGGELVYVPRYASTAETLSPDELAVLDEPAPPPPAAMPPDRPGPARAVLGWLRGHSYLANAVRNKARRLVEGPPAGVPFEYGVFAAQPDDAWEEAFDITARLVIETQAEAARQGADFLLVLAPARFQVYDDAWEETLNAYPTMQDGSWDLIQPHALLAEAVTAAGVPTLDLLPVLRACAADRPHLYERYGIHWTADGHALVADVLKHYLGPGLIGVEDSLPACANGALK